MGEVLQSSSCFSVCVQSIEEVLSSGHRVCDTFAHGDTFAKEAFLVYRYIKIHMYVHSVRTSDTVQ